jgi:predicted acyl esterase
MSQARRWTILAVVLVVGATAMVALASGRESLTSGSGTSGRAAATITATDGVRLSAETYTPTGTDAPALVVMPVPFGSPGEVYRPIAAALQCRGYEVVTYLQRGFHESQGEVDFAGAATQRDASTVITWALQHTRADAERIGMFGMSYGAGVSLLAAAHDRRIRAVAALSTWTDLVRSYDANDTPSRLAFSNVINEAQLRLSPSVLQLAKALRTPSAFSSQLAALSPTRSPQTYVAQLNHNDPAIMIANAYEDSFLPPAQLVDFFAALTTPKRLQLAPGDHGGPEYTALHGQDNATVDDAFDWLDHFLRSRANGITDHGPILLTDARTRAVHEYQTWPQSGSPIPLGDPNTGRNVGSAASWSAALPSATDSGADSGFIQHGPAQNYRPPVTRISRWDEGAALVWSGDPLPADRLLSGTPQVHVRVASTTSTATFFSYLYEFNSAGVGALVSVQPYTAVKLTPGAARSVTVAMQPIAWTARAGDRLALVIDTGDPRYASPTPAGAKITLSSTTADPASVAIPLGAA